jgi:hypothetical protein
VSRDLVSRDLVSRDLVSRDLVEPSAASRQHLSAASIGSVYRQRLSAASIGSVYRQRLSAASMVHRKIAGTQEYRVIPPIFRDSCCSAQNRRGQELGTGARTMFLTNICTKIDIMFYLQKNFKKFII